VNAPDMQKRIKELGYEPLGSSPREMAQRIHAELEQWTGIVKQEHLSLDQ
jgi:tripartite-type tricarboxylate transporter receptor subunit TctC